jgi:DNA-binding CsgD family transcriptional regulator
VEKASIQVPGLVGSVDAVRFTVREGQVLRLVCEGKTNKVIAAELGIQVDTVRDYVAGLVHDLEAGTRSGLLIFVMRTPKALAAGWVLVRYHPDNCDCPAQYCTTMYVPAPLPASPLAAA